MLWLVEGDSDVGASAPASRLVAPRLRAAGLSYAEIGTRLGMSAIAARDLCRQHDRAARAVMRSARDAASSQAHGGVALSGRAVAFLMAMAPDVPAEDKAALLPQIAASFSRNELLAAPNIGRSTVRDIDNWLRGQGFSLRDDEPAIAAMLNMAIDRLRMAPANEPTSAVTHMREAIDILNRAIAASRPPATTEAPQKR